MGVLTPNEKLTGITEQKREILDRLARYRAEPRRTLRLAEKYPHLRYITMDEVVGDLFGADAEVDCLPLPCRKHQRARRVLPTPTEWLSAEGKPITGAAVAAVLGTTDRTGRNYLAKLNAA